MAIQAVQRGHMYVTPLLDQRGAERLRGESTIGRQLTRRQCEVLQLVAEGKSAKEIAAELDISLKTAQFHKANAMRPLGSRTTAELVKYAVRHGITASYRKPLIYAKELNLSSSGQLFWGEHLLRCQQDFYGIQ